MQTSKLNETKIQLIKLILKSNFSKRRYTKDELPQLINDIIKNVKEECKNHGNIRVDDIISILVLHVHLNKEQLYFINTNVTREKLIEKYTDLFTSYVQTSENIINTKSTDIKVIKQKPSITNKPIESPPQKIFQPSPTLIHKQQVKTPFYTYTYDIPRKTDEYNGPYGTQWIHDYQEDDHLNVLEKKRLQQFQKLRKIILPEQRSEEWFAMRNGKITASDGGCVLGMNHYEPTFNFVIKKIVPSFQNNAHCYHGKKYEQIATMIYEYRMNVHVEEFGLLGHPKYNFLGASPDGICSPYKKDEVHLSKYVGRMLEIKCPVSRKIQKDGVIKDNICPIYYWVQVQLQLECCDLDECDFWQCSIYEYSSRDEFLSDTSSKEPFRSKKTGYEKGCLIQLLPKEKMSTILSDPDEYLPTVWADASFIYPENIELTPPECDTWVAETLEIIEKDPKYANVYVDRIIYWRLSESKNVLILRDKEWFEKYLPTLKRVWSYVEFFRKESHMDLFNIFNNYVTNLTKNVEKRHLEHYNTVIMETLKKICNKNTPDYQKFIDGLANTIYMSDDDEDDYDDITQGGSVFDD